MTSGGTAVTGAGSRPSGKLNRTMVGPESPPAEPEWTGPNSGSGSGRGIDTLSISTCSQGMGAERGGASPTEIPKALIAGSANDKEPVSEESVGGEAAAVSSGKVPSEEMPFSALDRV